jgi:prepilin-type N-terminal cleavage/methylation domain-containing protein
MKKLDQAKGFTLVELAIVIVIIGLLVGGVLQGQELIKAAKMNRFFSTLESYKSAVFLYKGKHNFLPGDNPRAFMLLSQTGCTNTTVDTANPTGCNGNGDSQVIISETFRAWQSLSVDRLLKGSFTGLPGPASVADHIPDVNVPSTAYSNTGVVFGIAAATSYSPPLQVARGGALFIGQEDAANANSSTFAPFLTGEDMFIIDTKFDDGEAITGRILAYHNSSTGYTNCVTSSDPAVAKYDLTNTNIICSMIYNVGW